MWVRRGECRGDAREARAQDRRDGVGSSGRSARLRAHDCHRRGIAQQRRGILSLPRTPLLARAISISIPQASVGFADGNVHHDGDEAVSSLARRWREVVPCTVTWASGRRRALPPGRCDSSSTGPASALWPPTPISTPVRTQPASAMSSNASTTELPAHPHPSSPSTTPTPDDDDDGIDDVLRFAHTTAQATFPAAPTFPPHPTSPLGPNSKSEPSQRRPTCCYLSPSSPFHPRKSLPSLFLTFDFLHFTSSPPPLAFFF